MIADKLGVTFTPDDDADEPPASGGGQGGNPIDDEAEYRSRADAFFQPYQASVPYDADQIATDYLARVAGSAKPFEAALSAIWTDFMFACNAHVHTADKETGHGR